MSQSRLVIQLSVFLSLLACVMSVYLVYILVFVLQKICLVCMGVHLVNVLLSLLFTLKWRTVSDKREMAAKKVQ